MRLRWDCLFAGIFFFGAFFFAPLLKAVGSTQTTLIICVGLIAITLIKIVEYSTEHRNQEENENEEDCSDS